MGGVQWVVQRVEAMDGDEIYLTLGVIGVNRVHLSKEVLRVRHVGDAAKQSVCILILEDPGFLVT